MKAIKHNHKPTDAEMNLLCSLPISPRLRQRLERLFDKIDKWQRDAEAKEKEVIGYNIYDG